MEKAKSYDWRPLYRFTNKIDRSTRRVVLAVVCAGTLCAQAHAEAGTIEMQFASTPEGNPQIEGGMAQVGDNWPSTLKFYEQNKFVCTATVIGERAVITAGHCLSDEKQFARINLSASDQATLTCTRHPNFNLDGLQADIALCLSDKVIRLNDPGKDAYESLDLRVIVDHGARLFLLGFGCRNVNDPSNPNGLGQLYGGPSTVSELPGDPHYPDREHIRTTVRKEKDVVICPGDSGGSAYLPSDIEHPFGPRSIIGINSGYIADGKVSAITSLAAGAPKQFILKWAKDNNAKICGIDLTEEPCKAQFSH